MRLILLLALIGGISMAYSADDISHASSIFLFADGGVIAQGGNSGRGPIASSGSGGSGGRIYSAGGGGAFTQITVDKELVELVLSICALIFALFSLHDSVHRTNKLSAVRGVSKEPYHGVLIASLYSLLTLSFWLYWHISQYRTVHFYASEHSQGAFNIVVQFPGLFTPGIWLATLLPAAFALHYFVLLGFDRGANEQIAESNEQRPQMVAPFHMIYTLTIFAASLIRVMEYFFSDS